MGASVCVPGEVVLAVPAVRGAEEGMPWPVPTGVPGVWAGREVSATGAALLPLPCAPREAGAGTGAGVWVACGVDRAGVPAAGAASLGAALVDVSVTRPARPASAVGATGMGSPRPVEALGAVAELLVACGLAGMRAAAGPASSAPLSCEALGRAGAGSSVLVAAPRAGAGESA